MKILLLLVLCLSACSAKQEIKNTERTKLIITQKKDESKTEVECFCPEQKKDASTVITAISGVVTNLLGALF